MDKKEILCHSCEKTMTWDHDIPVSRRDECPHCSCDLHCCRMCQFYDTKVYNQCREPMADRVIEKEKSNFCDYFVLSGFHVPSKKEDFLAAANALFKK